MAINYSIKASIVDINSDAPSETDIFFVDTNVWFWFAYSNATISPHPPKLYQVNDYPNYLKKILTVKALMNRSTLSFTELASVIERVERSIYNNARAKSKQVEEKEFRHNCVGDWEKTFWEVESAWRQVESASSNIDCLFSADLATEVLAQLKIYSMGAYDAAIVNLLFKNNCLNIITDDGDFCTVKGLTMFTANETILNAARAQNKLIAR
jgi:predicted nucleic acid-binding protein